MHDLVLIDEIITQAESNLEAGQKIKSITIQLGALAPLTEQEVLHIAEHRDWRVKVEKIPARVSCKCGYRGEPKIIAREHDIVLFECPVCSDVPEVEQGTEIIIKKIDVEDN